MSNINTGSMTGFSGLVPQHLQAGAGANSASRAVVQDSGDHGSQPQPMFDHKPTFQSAADNTGAGMDVPHMVIQKCNEWIGGMFEHNQAPAV